MRRQVRDEPDDGLTRKERARRWRIENAEAIKEYNERIDREGTFAMRFELRHMTSAKTDPDQPADLTQAALTRKRQWENENREALENYNRFVEENGVFSDGLRAF